MFKRQKNLSVSRQAKLVSRLLAGLVFMVLLFSTSAQAKVIKVGGTGGALGTMKLLAETYQSTHPEAKIKVLPSLGSGGGIKAVLAGAIQVAVSSRPLKSTESEKGARSVEYGRTPFVFAVGTNTRVDAVTEQDLVDIYSGTRETWQDGTRIRIVLRPVGDSDSAKVKSISPAVSEAKSAAEQRPGMLYAVTDQETADHIEKIDGAFGASTLAQINAEQRSMKPLRLNGVDPIGGTIADGSYPYYKPFIIVTSPKTTAAAQQFVDFIGSDSGREILSRLGYALP